MGSGRRRPARSTAPDLAAFVPALAAEMADGGVPSWLAIEGSMLSADISGFTALSERLASKGKAGAEAITELINTCFTALIDEADRYAGEVVKFGGDALLIVFRGANHERRAADAATAMQRALHATPAAKRASLTMTVGVAEGPFDCFLVGSGYRDLLLSGPRATEVIRLEAAAAKGETLVTTTIADRLPAAMRRRDDEGGVVVVGATGDVPTGPAARVDGAADLRPYLPDAVTDQLAAFAGLAGEHRLVTVGFVSVGGVAGQLARWGPLAVAEDLTGLLDDIVKACDRYGVSVLHSDIAPDGVKFVLCAGAPVNAGDTADAMLRAALQIASVASPFTIKQGVQTGRVFAGFLGSPSRRTYTLMGDPVNTAARMLGKAGDREVVAVASVVQETRTVFVTDELEPFLVKGKSEPIVAHKVREATSRVRRDSASTRLIGRQTELDVLTHAIGQGGEAVEVVGAAGVGKSRLLDAAWSVAESLITNQGACTPYGAATPYGVFRPLLRGAASIPEGADPDTAGRMLTGIVGRVARPLLPMLPLLAAPFGARVESTPEADAIDPDYRRVRMHDVVVQFLEALQPGPVAFLVEDAQWIDDASGELTNHLARCCAGRPWSVVVTRRPEGEWHLPDDVGHATHLVLEPLDALAINQLAVEVSSRPLGDRDLAIIAERSQGNPLFAIELARALSETTAELPGTIEQIIASRLDRLPPGARRLVRVAAVLGNLFDEEIVRALMEADGVRTGADEALAAAVDAGTLSPRSSGHWSFNHALYRDTAYAGLPFARRRQLHRLAARIISERIADPALAAPLLSLHFAAAGAHPEAWQHSLVAGASALAQGATNEAAVAFERAMAASRWCVDLGADAKADVAERLGDLYYELGRFPEAARVYARARAGTDDPVADTRLLRKTGSVNERQGRPARALQWYERARRSIPPIAADAAWAAARADVLLAEAAIRARMGDNQTCLALALAAHYDARLARNARVEALALERTHLALAYLRRPDTDRAGPRAVELYRKLNDQVGMARVLTNLGIEAYFASDWSRASERYLEALELAQRTGSVVPAATAAINSAEILSDQGSWSAAIELLERARRNYDAVGYVAGSAAATLFAAVAATRAGHSDDAAARFVMARTALDRLGMADLVDELDSRELELRVVTGQATRASCEALEARFGPHHPCGARVARCRALVEHAAGDPSATTTMREALRRAPDGYEGAITRSALAAVAPDDPEAGAWREDAEATFRRLGVTSPPPLPV